MSSGQQNTLNTISINFRERVPGFPTSTEGALTTFTTMTDLCNRNYVKFTGFTVYNSLASIKCKFDQTYRYELDTLMHE